MKQEVKKTDDKTLTISIEDFDALEGNHRFSKEYQKKKRKMYREYRRTLYASTRNYAKTIVAASVLIIAVPAAVHAANDSDFFNRIWGSLGKKNIAAHEEVIYEEEKGTSYSVTYPGKEYVDIAPEQAEKLIGENISNQTITEQLNDTKMTILSAVSDGQAAVVEYTLERKGGVNALIYDQSTNESKGADFSDEATFYFNFSEGSGNLFVDLERSSDDMLYCYDYMVLDSNTSLHQENNNASSQDLHLEIEEYPCTRGELYDEDGGQYTEDIQKRTVSIPLKKSVKTATFANADGGTATISPLSMKIDMAAGLGLTPQEYYSDSELKNLDPDLIYDASQDPGSIYYAAITDKKGKTYIVEHSENSEHSCDAPINNSVYACGDEYSHLTYVFNRLVDTDDIASITVNDTEYTRQ